MAHGWDAMDKPNQTGTESKVECQSLKPNQTEGEIHSTYTMSQTNLAENRTEDYRISLTEGSRCLVSQTEDEPNRTEQSLNVHAYVVGRYHKFDSVPPK